MLRIAIVSHVFGFGDGQGRVNYEIVRFAVDSGVHVTLIAEKCAEDLAKHDLVRFIKVPKSSLPTQLLRNLSFAIRSIGWVKRIRKDADVTQVNGFVTFARADIVATHFVHGAWLKSPYASPSDKRWNLYALYQRANTWANSILEQTAFRRAERVIAVSERVASELRFVGVQDRKIVVVFNGVDTEEFQPRESDRSQFSLPKEVTLFLFSGDIRTHRKNVDGVLRAIAKVEGVHLAVAGRIDDSPYPALAKELGIADRVHFLGYVAKISTLMAATDGFIFPTRYDPMPLVVLEAMASGLPIITAKTTGASDVLDEPEWTLENPEDVPQLARMIRRLADDSDLRRRLGESNRAKALAHTWSSMASEYLEQYRLVKDEKRVQL